MKRFLFALLLGVASVTPAQQQPSQPSPDLELKAQLAEANLTIAQLRQQVSELQVSLLLAQRAVIPQLDQVRSERAQNVAAAAQAATVARNVANQEQQKSAPKK